MAENARRGKAGDGGDGASRSPRARGASPASDLPSPVSADGLEVNDGVVIPRSELSARASRAGGAGGQHVNTSSTRMEVLWNPSRSKVLSDDQRARLLEKLAARLDSEGNVRVVASDTRSQGQNRALAEGRLAELVRRALVVPKVRKKSKPSRGQREERLREKKQVSTKKKERRGRDWE